MPRGSLAMSLARVGSSTGELLHYALATSFVPRGCGLTPRLPVPPCGVGRRTAVRFPPEPDARRVGPLFIPLSGSPGSPVVGCTIL